MNVKGIARYTMAQDIWDGHRDYIERDEDNNVIGIWASYYDNEVIPENPTETVSNIYSVITYKGSQNRQIKINGYSRVFYVTFYKDNEEIPFRRGDWSFEIDGQNADRLFNIDVQQDNSTKIKFNGNDDYIGKKVVIKFTSIDGVQSSIDMNISGN